MKNILPLLVLLLLALTTCGQKYKYPGQLEIRTYKIGDKVDTTLFKKYGDLYFPNYLDGGTIYNCDKLPKKYRGLPIAIWQLKSDSSIALTLLKDIVLNITVSYMKEEEKEKLSKFFTEKFGADGKLKSYKETHPFQSYFTFWYLKTWKTKDVIVQIGYGDLRNPNDPIPNDIHWNLVYSDFILETKVINDYKMK